MATSSEPATVANFAVVDVVPVDEEDSPFVGFLMVEAA
jgi:hypothetical protein